MEVKNLVPCNNILGEGPLWHPVENVLYWVDISGKKIQRYDPQLQTYQCFEMPKRVSALAMREGGGFVCTAEDGFFFWDGQSSSLELIAKVAVGDPHGRFNDGKVDRAGRFWAGTMTPEGAVSALYRLDADLSVHTMIENVTISNGIGWSPDNRIMYYVDSNRNLITTFDFDLGTGSISNQTVLKHFEADFGVPDGLTVDSEGFVWCAIYGGWKVIRLAPDSEIVQEFRVPVARPSSVAFGGDGLEVLYFTSISEGLSAEAKEEQPQAGDMFMFKPGVRGLPEPKFAG